MIMGFNHNISYRGIAFHVQTEDSGPHKPQLVTLLYHGGTIIASQKTLYADIIRVDHLDQVVEELAKEQHKGMLKKLTRGEFDERIGQFGIILDPLPGQPPNSISTVKAPLGTPSSPEKSTPPVTVAKAPVADKFQRSRRKQTTTLDDLIYAYLTAGRDSDQDQ